MKAFKNKSNRGFAAYFAAASAEKTFASHATALLVALCLLLCGVCGLCGCEAKVEEPDGLTQAELNAVRLAASAAKSQNESLLIEKDFMLSVAPSDGTETVFFAQGSAICEKGTNPLMSGKMTQIQGGSASTFDIYYKAGAYYTAKGESKFYTVLDKDLFTKQFIFADALVLDPNYVTEVQTAESADGTIYKFKTDASHFAEELYGLFGTDIYTICGIKKAQEDKTSYAELCVEYLIDSNGALKTRNIKFSVTLHDTPPYLPGEAANEADYVKTFDVTYTVTVTSTASELSVTLPTTSEFTLIG